MRETTRAKVKSQRAGGTVALITEPSKKSGGKPVTTPSQTDLKITKSGAGASPPDDFHDFSRKLSRLLAGMTHRVAA